VDVIRPGEAAADRRRLAIGEHLVPDAAVEAQVAELDVLGGPVHDHDLRVGEVAGGQEEEQRRA
jgi:hypothetical protein